MASTSSSASNSQYCPQWKYDVFLSFRGEDTRETITGYLYERLTRRGIITFQDDKRLERGDSISEELLKAIEESQVALVVFSKNYATSKWCLNELLKIIECMKDENGQTVIPVFYDVDPSHVRYQSQSFAEAFAKHELRYSDGEVQRWRTALTAAANLKGYVFPDGLPFKKVLIVLDDIDDRDQLDYLAKDLGWFGKGSRIIATTRDKHLRRENDVVFEVETLLDCDAIKLFNQYAFVKEVPECFKDLTLKIVHHAKGLPLALKVLGSSLHGMDKTEWVSALNRIKENPGSKINENLKISYDGLEPEEKEIFLDIACFFRGKRKKKVMQVLESCYEGSQIGLRVLVHKSLVFISEYETIEMHDLIQDMGRYIVKMQKHPGERSRLWNAGDFKEVMDGNTGTKAMEVIWMDYVEKLSTLSFSKKAMKNMKRLRILHIHNFQTHDDSIEYLPNSLRWFECHGYPWESLPEDFKPNRLVHLNLGGSSLQHLWIGTKHLPSLRCLDLRFCHLLRRTPDFTGMPNLEYLDLEHCTSLEEVHPSLKCCGKLIWLNLDGCESLERFPYVNVESLRWLHLGCSNLRRTPDFTGMPNLEYLDLYECRSLEEVHPSLKCCGKLIQLNLFNCYRLERFPYVNVESLEHLDLVCCSSLEKFPEFLGRMKPELEILMAGSGIKEIPPSIFLPQAHLTELDLSYMENLVALPSSICKLKGLVKLDVSGCSKLVSLPSSICKLKGLVKLHVSGCSKLVSLPSSICKLKGLVKLDVSGCSKLESLPEEIGDLQNLEELRARWTLISRPPPSIFRLNKLKFLSFEKEEWEDEVYFEFPKVNEGLHSLEELDLSFCNLIDGGLPEDIGCLSSLKELNLRGNNFEHLPQSITQLGALRSLDLSYCKRLTQLPEFPEQLHTISADWSNDWICNSLFQNISSLQHDISASDSLSLRVFTSRLYWKIPSWFHHRGTGTSVSVNLPENWYISDNFLGFAVCYSGRLIDITAHLIPLCDDGMSSMTQKFALSNHSEVFGAIHFFLVPFAGLWDTSKANGKTPNDYGHIILSFPEELKGFGLRLLYKDEPELYIGIRRSRYDDSEHHEEDSSTGIRRSRYDGSEHHEEASCSSSKKQRSQASEFCQ